MDKKEIEARNIVYKKIKNKKLVSMYRIFPGLFNKGVIDLYLKFGEPQLKDFNEKHLEFRENLRTLDNNIYTGQVDDSNRRHGFGILLYNNKSLYIGYFKSSVCKGLGWFYSIEGNLYKGKWADKFLKNEAEIYYADGMVYQGQTAFSSPHGKGVLECPGKWKYTGKFYEGLKHGKGRQKFEDGSIYEGDFHRNKMQGIGKYKKADGSVYEGEMVSNKMNGKGVLIQNSKSRYEGEFLKDTKEGFGEMVYSDNSKYIGYWKNDRPDGIGKEIRPDGLVVEGFWKQGMLMECYNGVLDDVEETHYEAISSKIPNDMEEMKLRVKISRNLRLDVEEEDEEVFQEKKISVCVKIEPCVVYSTADIIKILNDLPIITVSHPVYNKSYAVFQSLEPFDYTNSDFNPKKLKFLDEWDELEEGLLYKGEKNTRNMPEGKGVVLSNGNIYHGFFLNGEKSSLGREIFSDGIVYEGYWDKNKKNGFGVEKLNKEKMYSGDWVNNKKHGDGVFTTHEWRYIGNWENNLQEGMGKLIYRNKNKYKGEFHLGYPHGYGSLTEKNGKVTLGIWKRGKLQRAEKDIKGKTEVFTESSTVYSVPIEISIVDDEYNGIIADIASNVADEVGKSNSSSIRDRSSNRSSNTKVINHIQEPLTTSFKDRTPQKNINSIEKSNLKSFSSHFSHKFSEKVSKNKEDTQSTHKLSEKIFENNEASQSSYNFSEKTSNNKEPSRILNKTNKISKDSSIKSSKPIQSPEESHETSKNSFKISSKSETDSKMLQESSNIILIS